MAEYKEYKSGGQRTCVIKCRPEEIKGILLIGDTLHHDRVNGINAGYFPFKGDRKAPENCWSLAVSEGKPIGPNSHIVSWNTSIRRSVIAFDGKNMLCMRVNHYNEIPGMIWGISGIDLLNYNRRLDAFGIDVYRSGPATMIGFDKDDNIHLVVRSYSTIKRQIQTAKNLNLVAAIRLDSGGSSQLNYNGRGFRSSRRINSAIILS